jgi:hypothetical protein
VLVVSLVGIAAADSSGTGSGHHPWIPPRLGHGRPHARLSPNGTKLIDGLDPEQAACDRSIVTLASADLRLAAPVTIRGRLLRSGAIIGHVTLRYSPACQAAWGRIDPMPVVDSPSLGTVDIDTIRPADGTHTAFHLGRLEEAYVDMLLTGLGCVQAEGTITLAAGPVATATTRCMAGRS